MWNQHLAVYRDTGIETELLANPPEAPFAVSHVWDWFCALSRQRGSAFGIEPLKFADMAAYFGLIGRLPQPWERELLLSYDQVYLDVMTAEDVVEIGSDDL